MKLLQTTMDFSVTLILTLALCLHLAYGATIESANENVTVVLDSSSGDSNHYYNMSMDENNHDYVLDSLTPLLRVTGADSEPTISLASGKFAYELNPDAADYILYSKQSFDYEAGQTNYVFYIYIGSELNIVRFAINNIDDEPPTLTAPQCTLDENTIYTVENSSCECTVADPDGWLGEMVFEIQDGGSGDSKIFKVEIEKPLDDFTYKATVYVTTTIQLNYKDSSFHSFDIRATDGAGHTTTPNELVRALVYVNDLRNTNPVWTTFLTYERFEEKTNQTFNPGVQAVDGDTGIGAIVNYRKVWEDEDEENYIQIDKETGEVTVRGIDRDRKDISMYNFQLLAYIADNETWQTPLNVGFFIEDVDDNPPVLEGIYTDGINTSFSDTDDKLLTISFLENYAGGFNTTIYIRDVDTGENSQFTVELEELEGSVTTYTSAFFIVPTAGYRSGTFDISVKNSTYLDYENEEWDNFQFNVLTKGILDANKLDRMLVNVTLIDYNDEIPIFPEDVPTITYIKETAKTGTFIEQVLATDRDAEDEILVHELLGSSYALSVLRIDSPTGEIYVNADDAFDFDAVNPIFVQIRATDAVNHTAITPLTINLWDVNNKAPTITVSDLISVEENQSIGTPLEVTITASDLDTTANLTAELDWSSSRATKNSRVVDISNTTIMQQVKFLEAFILSDPDTTDITIELRVNANNNDSTTPDYELFDSLYLTLVVTDLNTDPEFIKTRMNTSTTLFISIEDINDNTPFFPENDLPEINRTERYVTEDANKGILAGTIAAIDLDVGDEVTYDCQPENVDFDWLDLDSKTGSLTVKADGLIDADSKKTWYFNYTCTARDEDPAHISKPLWVPFYVIDTNNKNPDITMESSISFPEKSVVNTSVSNVNYTDLDRDEPFHTAECSFISSVNLGSSVCAQKFFIDDNVIKVTKGLDDISRDDGYPEFNCTVVCSDNPSRNGSSRVNTDTKQLVIVLLDINDNRPQLDMDDTNFFVYENLSEGEEIHELIGKDIDYKENATIVFSISSVVNEDGEDFKFLFDIKNDTDYYINDTHKKAHLVALEDLRDYYGNYTIIFEMTDQSEDEKFRLSCDTAKGDKCDVTLEVKRFNFESPSFVYPSNGEKLILAANQDPFSQLIDFRNKTLLPNFVVSEDSNNTCKKWQNWEWIFDVEQISPDGVRVFEIEKNESCSFQLQVNSRFDSSAAIDVVGGYELILSARVQEGEELDGEASYSSNIGISVVFLNETEEPIFNVTSWKFSFYEEDASLSKPLEYKAYYIIDSERDPFYLLKAPDNYTDSFFRVDADTGTVSLKNKLDYEKDTQFTFQIVASNDRNSYSSNPNSVQTVTLDVIDINDHAPVWTSDSFYGAIMPTYGVKFPVSNISATDEDKRDQGQLEYQIANCTASGTNIGSTSDPFTINEQTGQILLNFAVDSSMSGSFQCDVEVSDKEDELGNIHHVKSTVTIFIITDDYVVKFKFENLREEVLDHEAEMLSITSAIINYKAYRKDIQDENEDTEVYTSANLFFINDTETDDFTARSTAKASAIEQTEILRIVTNLNTYMQLKQTLYNQTGLKLSSFPNMNPDNTNLEPVLRAWLIGVSLVLGSLCMVLLLTFILKTRQLNQRIEKLVNKKFGSQESGLNRLGVSLPTANKHAIEGSNPVYNTNTEERERYLSDFDRKSVNSGDSDLIGVEDNPEFDYNFRDTNNGKNISTYM